MLVLALCLVTFIIHQACYKTTVIGYSLGATTVGPAVKMRKSNYFIYLLADAEFVFNVSDRQLILLINRKVMCFKYCFSIGHTPTKVLFPVEHLPPHAMHVL